MGNNDIDALRSHTVLCRVSANAYGMVRVDNRSRARAGTSLDPGSKVLVPVNQDLKEIHDELVIVQTRARNALRLVSMPYGDEDGWRILPHTYMKPFLTEFTKAKEQFNAVRSRLVADNNPTMVTQGYFEPTNEVTPDDAGLAKARAAADAYTLTWRIQDYPAGQFPGLAENAAATLKERHLADLARVVAGIRPHALVRLLEPVQHLVTRLETHIRSVEAGGKAALRSSTFINVATTIALVEAFNVIQDQTVASAIDAARPLAELDFDVVKSDINVAREAHSLANNALEQVRSRAMHPLLTLVG